MALSYISSLQEIVDHYDAYIIDLWGVVHDGVTPYRHARNCLSSLKQHNKQVYFLSNAPRRINLVEEQLNRLGIQATHHYHGIYTSGEDTFDTISKKAEPFYQKLGIKVYPLSTQMHLQLFKDLNLICVGNIEEASFILNTGPAYGEINDYDDILQKACDLQLPMICANPDISVISGGKVGLCAGAFAQRYEQMGGIVKYHGKPHPTIYQNLLARMKVSDKRKILAIGDSLSTDIKGANGVGIDCALVMTGLAGQEFGSSDMARARLQQSTQEKGICPTYVLPELIF